MFTPSRDRGAAAVEFALVLPILLLLVIGIIEFGRAYHVQTTLSNAARDGVRVMALKNDPSAAQAAAEDAARGIDIARIQVSPTKCVSTSTSQTVAMVVTHDFKPVSGLLPFGDFTLTGRGTMRCSG